MPQIFHPSMNTLSRLTIFGAAFLGAGVVGLAYLYNQSPFVTRQYVIPAQPVPFSHEHHVRGLGIDCRYCHTSVETEGFAGIPPTYTCMSCHSQVWSDSPTLEPVRRSLREDTPIEWARVHNLPDFVYFHHGVHVQKGVGCVECHGRVDQMPLMWQDKPLTMQWCLDCHMNPAPHLRPREEVFNMEWKLPEDEDAAEFGRRLLEQYEIPTDRLSNCSVCHR